MAYRETLLYGRHELGNFAVRHARSARERQARLKRQIEDEQSYCSRRCAKLIAKRRLLSETHFGRTVEDLVFLSSLGITVATISFFIDLVINRCHSGQLYILQILSFSVAAQFFGWVGSFVVLACFSVGITHIIAPTAIGSGIPEIKTMMRGVVMKEYLTFRTLVAKIIGLMAALGSRLPVGKEGPFVHIASTLASVITKWLPSFSNRFQNYEKRMHDILAPACAAGVSCTFGAPFGGLLFSIEATATYFAVRNYWRSFYASVIGTVTFRVLAVLIHEEETLTALHKTHLPQEIPFDDLEMVSFAMLGLLCGLFGVLFITIHKYIVITLRQQQKIKAFLQKNRFIYPTLISCLVGALHFPVGIGCYYASELTMSDALTELFSNRTWTNYEPENFEEQQLAKHWLGPMNNACLTVGLFFVTRLLMSAISTTCPFPCGVFLPALTIGAALGRFVGELMVVIFPDGIDGHVVVPGGYALVGATAFAGAVTHTLSPVIIIIELTGQIGHLVPTLVAIVIANMCSRCLTQSIYDLIISIKKLPYLPPRMDTSTEFISHSMLAEDIMTRDLKYLTRTSTYQDARNLLDRHHFKTFPIVESPETMMLVGSMERRDLHRAIDSKLSLENKLAYFNQKLQSYYSLPPLGTSAPMNGGRRCRFSITTALSDEDSVTKKSTTSTPVGSRRQSLVERKALSTILKQNGGTVDETARETEVHTSGTEDETETAVNRVHYYKPSLLLDIHDPLQEMEWETFELSEVIDYDRCRVNNAPFQIVTKMSLYQLHSLFSLLRLHHTLVTSSGRLVGIISLNEVRKAVQGEIDMAERPFGKSIADRLKEFCSFRPSGRPADCGDDDTGPTENGRYFNHLNRKAA